MKSVSEPNPRRTSFLIVVMAMAWVACSSSASTKGGDDARAGDSGTGVSFVNDVMPVLQQNCTLSQSCHGQQHSATVENLYLGIGADGAMVDPAVAKTVYAGLVGVVSGEDPSMDLVTPNAPEKSYLIYKLNDKQDTLSSDCAKTPMLCPSVTCTTKEPCGTSMPYNGTPLMIADPTGLQNITDWIAQGAKDN